MKKNLLKSKMSLHEDNNKTLSHKLKITPSAFSRKINGSSNFTIEEMKFIRKEYGLSDFEFLDIFFNNENVDFKEKEELFNKIQNAFFKEKFK